MLDWSEPLPEQCPPETAFEPNNLVLYRLAFTNPPTERDFYSLRRLRPNNIFKTPECLSRALSIWDNKESCINASKLPIRKNKQTKIMLITLKNSDGMVAKTFGPGHFSWWKTNNFDIMSVAMVE